MSSIQVENALNMPSPMKKMTSRRTKSLRRSMLFRPSNISACFELRRAGRGRRLTPGENQEEHGSNRGRDAVDDEHALIPWRAASGAVMIIAVSGPEIERQRAEAGGGCPLTGREPARREFGGGADNQRLADCESDLRHEDETEPVGEHSPHQPENAGEQRANADRSLEPQVSIAQAAGRTSRM